MGGGTTNERISRGFDRLAPIYDPLARLLLAGCIHESQVALLPRLPPRERSLIVGGGSGRFLADHLAVSPGLRAVSIDASPRMTRRTRARLERRGLTDRADLRVGGLECISEDERFDLVATHCFLDLFDDEELGEVVPRLDRSLEPGGFWLFSDFATPGQGVPGLARRAFVGGLYAFFRASCGITARRLPDFRAAFSKIRLTLVAESHHGAGLLTARLWQKPAIHAVFSKSDS